MIQALQESTNGDAKVDIADDHSWYTKKEDELNSPISNSLVVRENKVYKTQGRNLKLEIQRKSINSGRFALLSLVVYGGHIVLSGVV
ncbi:hypothetical protein C4D60_Mb02t22710 [Musa balbisiana]|uniref:Uncharacterized protein n=1 Tax=Musa balbisiana TaxID=52838 RepID=A0A4S8ICN2_MUSBA|nr:hypothetical protein C4D60_Mb02t22710 [Musa balbisiana]